ncbi:gamma-aminobutyric acid receptor subunit alpha-5-like [Parasteatoda tepidariorum]|uniref:gamma-aminobutyric acid receptor subunit alpha-5-like n=1 Tax=Parasteatoda tepidariorum TaxID=114398 RepID=UPI0039BCDA27
MEEIFGYQRWDCIEECRTLETLHYIDGMEEIFGYQRWDLNSCSAGLEINRLAFSATVRPSSMERNSFKRRYHAFSTVVLIVRLTNSLFYSCWALDKSEMLSNYDIDKEILDSIVLNSKYDKRQRPIPLTKVKVQVLLDSVATPDESSLNFDIEFILQRSWKDPRIRFNGTGRHEYINGLSHADGIWMPNTNMLKYGGFNIMIPHMNLRIHKDGFIIHASR